MIRTVLMTYATLCVASVHAADVADHKPKPAPGYKAQALFHDSAILGKKIKYLLFTPPGYDDPANAERRYPMIFLTQTTGGEMATTYRLMHEGILEPMLWLGSDNDGGEAAWSNIGYVKALGGKKTDVIARNEDYVVEELLPLIDKNYRTQPNQRVLMGQSKGGCGTIHMLLKRPDLFCAAIACDGALGLYDGRNYKAAGEDYETLISKHGDAVKDDPVLLMGGCWFSHNAFEYEGKLRGWGMRQVQRVHAPECGHSADRMMTAMPALVAATWMNGLIAKEKSAPALSVAGDSGPLITAIAPARITLTASPAFGGVIRYTTDAKPPTSAATEYRGPIEVSADTTIRAAVFAADGSRGREAAAMIRIATPSPAVPADALKPGLPEAVDGKRSGLLRVPETGVYRFTWVDAKKGRFVIGFAGQEPVAALNRAVALAAGWHHIVLIDKGGGSTRNPSPISWSGPGVTAGPIPADAFGQP